jgi:general secretion pathway protein D
MMKQYSNRHTYLPGLVALCLSLALPAYAQYRGGGSSRSGGYSRSSTSGSSGTGASTESRQYPNNTTIGDAYFSIDPETRRVVYIADPETAKAVAQVLTNLDRPKPQVLIKVVFLEVTYNKASDIGLEAGYGRQNMNGPVTSASGVNGFGISGLSAPTGTNFNQFGMPLNTFNAVSPMTQPGAGLYQILGQDYQVTLRAIAQAGNARILSRPSILARNNQPATITVGQEVPLITSVRYDTFGNAINSVQYTDVGVILSVTPFITPDGLVEMIISPQISSIDPTFTVPISTGVSAPVIDIRSADTVAVTADGQTVIIGGLLGDTKSKTETKIPLLGDIPLLGNLFKRRSSSDAKDELLIFLTPHIVPIPTELAALSAREKERSSAYKGLTEQELNKFLDELPNKKAAPGSGSKSGKQTPLAPPKGF